MIRWFWSRRCSRETACGELMSINPCYVDGGHRLTARRLVNFTIGHFDYIDEQIVLGNSYRNELTGYLLCPGLDIKVGHPVQIISPVERLLRTWMSCQKLRKIHTYIHHFGVLGVR